jgi:hypothetical protein
LVLCRLRYYGEQGYDQMMKGDKSGASAKTLAEFVTLMIAMMIAFALLTYGSWEQTDFENLAKGEQNTSRREVFNGKAYTAYTVKDIKALIDECRMTKSGNPCNTSVQRILWLGNSQLHYINQYRKGDHLAPYWLRLGLNASACIEPLGCSLPNVSLQEFLVLSRYAIGHMPVNLLLVELVFDDLREDDLRSDFNEMLTSDVAAGIGRSSSTAKGIMGRFLAKRKDVDGEEPADALSGTFQKPVEQWLNSSLSASWKLWGNRPQIEGNVYLALYNLRNFVLGVKPTTVRRMIRARYDLNMESLRDILDDCRRRGLPALLYIAPIRQDKPIPYNRVEYSRWKSEVREITERFGAYFVNLEEIVPGELWGTYTGDDIDFMHFRGRGHRLVAEALLPHVLKVLESTGH